jgi:hypothetical protein
MADGGATLWLAIAAAGVSAASAIQSARIQSANAKSQANMAQYEAEQRRVRAEAIQRAAGQEEDAHREKVRQLLGTQIAAGAQAGIGFDGSAEDLFRASLYDAETDSLAVRYRGAVNAASEVNGAQAAEAQGSMFRANAASSMQMGYLNAASSLVGSGASYYGRSSGSLNAPKQGG